MGGRSDEGLEMAHLLFGDDTLNFYNTSQKQLDYLS